MKIIKRVQNINTTRKLRIANSPFTAGFEPIACKEASRPVPNAVPVVSVGTGYERVITAGSKVDESLVVWKRL